MLEQEGYDLMGAAFEVYNEKRHGFLEDVYQECLEIEFEMRDVPYNPQHELKFFYKERQLRKKYVPDFFVFGEIIVEIKAVKNYYQSMKRNS